jgi:ABC-type branched-subunit amino acid transport system substrate-binding protein
VWELPDGASGVYSLASDDIRGPTVLAEWALSAGITQVVLLAPAWGPASGEVGVFREAFEGGGGSVLRVLDYEPGAAFFGEQMEVIRGLRPQGLVLPIPAEDVQAIAGQAAYFALDTLGVQLLGTGGWADDQVVQEVSERYLEGVVAAAPIRPDDDGAGYRRFVEAYESHFQRTLVEPALPALGYDAAILLLETMEMGARTPEEVQRALGEIRNLDGATGILAVENGRVVRQHEVVCFAGRRALPLARGERPVQIFRPYTPDEANPETGELPEGPGHPAGFACPQIAADSLEVAPGMPPDTGAVRRLVRQRRR